MHEHSCPSTGRQTLGAYQATARLVHLVPDALTLLGLVLSVCAAIAIAACGNLRPAGGPQPADSRSLATALLGLAFFLDAIDGPVARRLGAASAFGGVLDSVCDRCSDLIILGGCIVHYSLQGNLTMVVLAVVAQVNASAISYLQARVGGMRPLKLGGFWQRPERCIALLLGFATNHLGTSLVLLSVAPLTTVGKRLLSAKRVVAGKAGTEGKPASQSRSRGIGYFIGAPAAVLFIAVGHQIMSELHLPSDPLRLLLNRL